jgi:hypothetical protein
LPIRTSSGVSFIVAQSWPGRVNVQAAREGGS